jgi:plastocyanin
MRFRHVLALICLLIPFAAAAKNHDISQRNKAFSERTVHAKVGDTLTFRNDDPFVHSIFSLSEVQPFDLGPFKAGELRRVKLIKPGKIVVECAVHPQMKLVVEIAR